MYSLFDYAFAPRYVYVVSEERLREVERKEKEREIERVNVTIDRLVAQREDLARELNLLAPAKYETIERERTAEHHGGEEKVAA